MTETKLTTDQRITALDAKLADIRSRQDEARAQYIATATKNLTEDRTFTVEKLIEIARDTHGLNFGKLNRGDIIAEIAKADWGRTSLSQEFLAKKEPLRLLRAALVAKAQSIIDADAILANLREETEGNWLANCARPSYIIGSALDLAEVTEKSQLHAGVLACYDGSGSAAGSIIKSIEAVRRSTLDQLIAKAKFPSHSSSPSNDIEERKQVARASFVEWCTWQTAGLA